VTKDSRCAHISTLNQRIAVLHDIHLLSHHKERVIKRAWWVRSGHGASIAILFLVEGGSAVDSSFILVYEKIIPKN